MPDIVHLRSVLAYCFVERLVRGIGQDSPILGEEEAKIPLQQRRGMGKMR
jgi:hypothetical protein